MSGIDIDHLKGWIGSEQRREVTVTPTLAAQFCVTLDLAPPAGDAPLPQLFHWCLTMPETAHSGLGPDGHAARGGFLPPVPLPRRMWAGGALEFRGDIRTGDTVALVARVEDVTLKTGRSGTLVFATVRHEVTGPRGPVATERQDIVYREVSPTGLGDTPLGPRMPEPEITEAVAFDPVLLFRYSAVTFNGHRIHYDRSYCIEQEGYPGLIVHGPLQATRLAHLAARQLGRPLRHFAYRGTSPMFDGTPAALNAVTGAGGLSLWVSTGRGDTTMTAEAG